MDRYQSTLTTQPSDDRLARLAARGAARRAQLKATAAPRVTSPLDGAAESWPPPPPGAGGTVRARVLQASRPAPRKPRRHHAARGSRAAALLLSLGTTVGLAGYFRGLAASDATAKSGASAGATTPAGTAAPSVSSGGTAGSSAGTTAGSVLADGTYTGDVATNRWGPVQVQITVAGGSISDVAVLEVPSGNSKDVTINNRAVPVLVQSTLAAQSTQIDSVSGATYTSTSYKQSLQSAIDAARAAASN